MGFKSNTAKRARFEERYFDEHDRPVLRLDNIGTTCDIMDPVLFEPSTRIDHAREVVEHLRTIGHHLVMNDTGGLWRLRFLTLQGPRIWDWAANPNDGMTVRNESLPLAICRAALKAVEGKP